jgi:hypothetical protein
MWLVSLAAVVLTQAAPSVAAQSESRSARLLPETSESSQSPAWTWAGTAGGGFAGLALGVAVAVPVTNGLPPRAQASLNPCIYGGALGVGLIAGALGGYLLGDAARSGSHGARIGVWSLLGVLSTAATVAATVLIVTLLTPRSYNYAPVSSAGALR